MSETKNPVNETTYFAFLSVQFKRKVNEYGTGWMESHGYTSRTFYVRDGQILRRSEILPFMLDKMIEENPSIEEMGFTKQHMSVLQFTLDKDEL